MVEMVETAAILNQAGPRSLVILDEIGRGTATFDGLSIAWAAIEHLHEVNRSRALFATHYHELTALAARLPRLDQRHRPRQGMEGRRHLPARDRAGRRRPLLRHPGRAPRRPAAVGGRARPRGAPPARGDRPQGAGAHADRRPAAVLGGARQARSREADPLATLLDAIAPDELSAARGAGGALPAEGGAKAAADKD